MDRVHQHERWPGPLEEKALAQLKKDFASVSRLLDYPASLQKTVKLLSSYGFDVAWAAELDDENVLAMRHVSGNETASLSQLAVVAGHGLTGKVFSSGDLGWVDDYLGSGAITHEYDAQMSGEHITGLIAAPLIHQGKTFGVLAGGVRSPGIFGSRAARIMQQAAACTVEALVVADRARHMADAAVVQARQQIALDLHDTVGSTLFAMTATVRSMAHERDVDDKVKERLSILERQVSGIALALRDSLRVVTATTVEAKVEAALRSQCQAFEQRTGIGTRLLVVGPIPELPESLVGVLVYAVREGLLNVEKHADAAAVAVTLAALRKGVAVTVNDDGKALGEGDVPLTHGFGLTAVTQALSRVGGQLSLTQNADGGASLRAWLPC